MRPVVLLLRLTDNNGPTASKVQYHKFEVQEKLKVVTFDDANPPWDNDEYDLEAMKQEIVSIHRHRWDYGYTATQSTGYLLDPEYVDMNQHEDEETMEAFHTFVECTYYYPPAPQSDASQEEMSAYEAACASQRTKRSATHVQLL
ncbi:hypothetical protein CYMTET_32073 [Cymbomonas tetramitiformis]|uniref:Uncharacterized protein n=1 Tax=Cymbomonas tetramitiformis TaxID=36881 RepID=A0AAE0KSK9_9CHLO|nr:hypothetical protein CYMTET_32073 [Cymbomonas tetramitiformis]